VSTLISVDARVTRALRARALPSCLDCSTSRTETEAERIAKEKAAKAEADRKPKEADEAARHAKEEAEKAEADRAAEA